MSDISSIVSDSETVVYEDAEESPSPYYGRLKVVDRLGEGSHGEVFLVQDNRDQYFAVKTALAATPGALLLQNEYQSYKQLGCDKEKQVGLPQIHGFGVSARHNLWVMVMSRLGTSVRDVMKLNGGSLPQYAALRIGIQVLRRLAFVHEKGIVHGDVSARNILCSFSSIQKVYLVDFGLSKSYIDEEAEDYTGLYAHTGMYTRNFNGTFLFASLNAHWGRAISRRDDLQSLGYVLLYLMKGSLPWSREEHRTPLSKYRVQELKETTSIPTLCHGVPYGFFNYLRYVRDLDYEDDPDYVYLASVLQKAMSHLEDERNIDNGENLDIWVEEEEKRWFFRQYKEEKLETMRLEEIQKSNEIERMRLKQLRQVSNDNFYIPPCWRPGYEKVTIYSLFRDLTSSWMPPQREMVKPQAERWGSISEITVPFFIARKHLTRKRRLIRYMKDMWRIIVGIPSRIERIPLLFEHDDDPIEPDDVNVNEDDH